MNSKLEQSTFSVRTSTNLSHYKTIVRPLVLYALKWLNIVRKKQVTKLELKHPNILKNIMGLVSEEGKYRKSHKTELYKKLELYNSYEDDETNLPWSRSQDEQPEAHLESLQHRV